MTSAAKGLLGGALVALSLLAVAKLLQSVYFP